jgi:hypothetical protein
MRSFKREFSFSNNSCERKKIEDESRRKSQIDVFIVIILVLKVAFSLNYLSASLALVFVFVATTFSLRANMWEEEVSKFISTCVFMTCVLLTCVFLIHVILICVLSTCVFSMSCAERLEIIIKNSQHRKENKDESWMSSESLSRFRFLKNNLEWASCSWCAKIESRINFDLMLKRSFLSFLIIFDWRRWWRNIMSNRNKEDNNVVNSWCCLMRMMMLMIELIIKMMQK